MQNMADSDRVPSSPSDATKDTLLASDSSVKVDRHSKLRQAVTSIANVHEDDDSSDEDMPPTYTDAAAVTADPPTSKHVDRRSRISEIHLGRRVKDRLTHTTHEERALNKIAEAERKRRTREAMQVAMATGERQLVGKDANGKDVYVEPPTYGQYYRGLNNGPYGYGGYGYGGYGYAGYGLGLGLDSLLLGGLLFGGFW